MGFKKKKNTKKHCGEVGQGKRTALNQHFKNVAFDITVVVTVKFPLALNFAKLTPWIFDFYLSNSAFNKYLTTESW